MIRYAIYALSVMTVFVAPVYASGLTATQSVHRLVVTKDASGTEQVSFVAVDTVAPGDRILYSLAYINDSADMASNVNLVMPVPAQVAYVENTVTGEGASVAFSVDGGETYAPRGDLTISVDGQSRMALAEEITHIRWTFDGDIAPAATGDVSYLGLLR